MSEYLEWILSGFTIFSIYLTQQKNTKLHKWPSLIGLILQPFWFWFAIYKQIPSFIFLSIAYTYVWALGFYIHWIKKKPEKCTTCGK